VGDEGRQQAVAQPEQLPQEFPFHGVDPLAASGGPVHKVPQDFELLLALEGGMLGGDDYGEVP
jgi:hypothetical protein